MPGPTSDAYCATESRVQRPGLREAQPPHFERLVINLFQLAAAELELFFQISGIESARPTVAEKAWLSLAESCTYSDLSATSGSTFVARRAGI